MALRAEFLPGREGRVYTVGSGLREDIKAPGYFAFAPARLADGSVVVVNRGYVANAQPDASLRPIGLAAGAVDLVGAMLDRNGLRPAKYAVSADGFRPAPADAAMFESEGLTSDPRCRPRLPSRFPPGRRSP